MGLCIFLITWAMADLCKIIYVIAGKIIASWWA